MTARLETMEYTGPIHLDDISRMWIRRTETSMNMMPKKHCLTSAKEFCDNNQLHGCDDPFWAVHFATFCNV